VMELASACSLSESHFARCFRTSKSLVEVALLSGFCDQAAFARSFSRMEHITPSHWRRANSGAAATERPRKALSRTSGGL
jgi:AraC-like DNA-binding protein